MAEQDFDNLSNEELLRSYQEDLTNQRQTEQGSGVHDAQSVADQDFSQMSNEELLESYLNDMRSAEGANNDANNAREGYGFMERQNDQITAEGGRDTYTGQALIEGATPFTRAMRQGKERDEDRELGAWLSDGEDNTLRVALKKHGLERDPSLEGYKAKETGGFWEGFSDDMSRTLAQLPLGAGWLFRKAREADNPQKYATDHLMQSAFLSGFSRADIEQAKEFSQGDPAKMYDFFAERAEKQLKGFSAKKQGAQEKLAAHADEEGTLSKAAGGVLGMVPMMEEFALGGAVGRALTGATKLGALAKALPNTWRGRVVGGLIHGAGSAPVVGTELTRRRYGELTADEYAQDENGNLVKREGDDTATALKKAAVSGYGEAAIFSMPLGEAALGWTAPVITKALRTKVGQTAAKMYENYVKYGQMTGLRGQPQMLALMDLNAFKDEVLGYGVKDADYEGFDKAWDKFVNGEDLPDGTHRPGTLSLEGQADMFIGTLGVMLAQGSVAGANAWRHGRAQKLSNDRRLHAAFNIPQEQLDKMEPELKRMLVRVGDNLYNGRDAFGRSKVRAEQDRMHGKNVGTFEERLKRWCDKVGERLGKASGEVFDEAGKYALEFDNSFGWEKDAGTGRFASRFQVPEAREMRVGRDGVGQEHSMIPWEDVDVPLGNGVSVEGNQFTDPNTGISVLRYLRTDAKAGDNGYIYLIRDENGHRATRYGSADAMDAARAMDVVNQRNESMRNTKAQMADKIRASMPALEGADMFYAKDGAEFDAVLQQFSENPIGPTGSGVRGVTLPNGRVMLCLDRIENPQQMKDTMLHEAGRHAGLDLALPDVADKMGFVAGLAKSGDPVVQNQLNRIVEARMAKGELERPEDIFKRDKDGNYLHANALEEVYAHLFDRSDVPEEAGWWDAHMNAMRRNIRKVFKGLSYSRSEAEEMYRGAMEKLKEQTGYSFYEPEVSPRERMVAEQRQREENQRIGHEAERDVAEIMDEEGLQERRRAEGEALGERVQGEADAQRNEQGAENVRAALDEAGNEIGAERERREKAREITRKRKEEIAEQKAEGEAYDEQERQRIERERKEEQDAQDEAELRRLYDAEEREADMAKREEYQKRRREITERRARERAVAKEKAEAEAVRAAEERQKEAAEREEQRMAGYDAADRQARIDRKTGIKQAFREDDARKGEEYDRAEEERKRREAEEEAALPKITVAEEPQGKERTAPQNDALRVNYGPNGNQIIARRVTDESGKVIGWDVNAVGNDGTETYIASTTKPKKDGLAAIRAVRRQIHDHFGLPYGKEARDAMDAERRRLEEAERTGDRKDEARTVRDEEQPQSEPREERLSAEGEDEGFAETGNPQGEERDAVVVHHANEGREGEGVKAAEDALQGLFGDEGIMSRPEGAESVEARSRASDDDLAFLRSLPPDFRFFDQSEGLMDDNRRDGNQKLVNLIGNLYDMKKIRGFGGFAKLVKAENPAIWAEQKDRLRGLWNYAAELSDGEIPRVGDNEARDAIRSADEGRNVRDVSGINALQAALQNIDVEMYPAAKLDSSDSRVPNMKREADPKTGIIPGNELKGRPRSLLSKPILGVEFEDGTVAVGTGRHRKNLYERFGMDIPMRRVREADGWVTKKPDGTYDFTKIRLLDALDNIQDGKGSVEDYVAFFRDVQIPRGEAESEGFLGSKEARYAYAIANDAHPDVRAAINYEGGKVDGMIKPEQAAAIAEIAPVGGERAKENADLQHYLLKAVQKDSSLDRRDLDIKASEAMHMARVKQAQDGAQQMGFDFFGDEDVQNAAAKAEKYRAQQAAKFSRLAKNLRQAQRSNENDLAQIKIARDDMRELGINERKVAAGGKEKRDELQKAIDNALLQQMRWESVSLDPDLRAQMEKDLGIAPTAAEKSAESGRDFALESVTQGQINAETEAQRQRDEIKRRLEAPLKAGAAEDGQSLMDLGGQEGGDLFNKVRFYDENESAKDFEKRQYAPAKYRVPGAVKSRTLLEEPPALRATEPPDNDYKIQIPPKHIKNGDLQEHQLEFVGYAGRAHGMKDANGSPLGLMGGYGTGAGKSRMIAGTILDNRWRGRNRALWITTQRGLIDDVRSECEPFGMGNLVEDIGDKPVPKNGIGFTTYSNLRNEGVVQKIAKELGKDFDGVIAFDEIHRAKTEGGRTQDAVVKLQELLPKAKVIYMSATGATDVGNLGYATRLGLWGEGTPFKDFEDFKNKVEGKGVSAMEMVARTLKRRGQYLSANLSKEGVEFDHVAVPTTDAQKRTYTEYNNALKDVYRGVYDALEVLGRLDYKVPPSSLHGMQQRLHYSMVTALKIPTLIERAKQELAKGNVPVFSLVNTNEAGATREVAKALEEGRQVSMDEVNFGPKQILLDFLTKEGDKTYKTKSDTHLGYKDYQFPTMKPIKDPGGEVIGFERDQIADGIRRRLVSEVEKLPDDFGNPINMIIDAFGKDNVANLTGLNREGMAKDYKAFQDGDKKVLVFSGVANTGYTFSSDRKYKNQARRVAFPLQLGYRADELEQTLGRVHRNNQANAPIYVASTTDLPGERRFYSSVERRRGQMKALTTGDRAATGNGITSEGDNFETKYAQQAVDAIIATLHRMGKLDNIAREMNFIKRIQKKDGTIAEVNGMLKRDKSGAILPNVSAKRFLNRLLMLDPKKQDNMFSAFKNYLDQIVRWAKEDGEYDIGLQDIGSTHNDPVRSVKLADDMDVAHVNSWFKTDKVSFDDFAKAHAAEFLTYVRNKRTGETFAVRADGKMGKKQEPAAMRYAVDGTKRRMKASILDTDKPNAAYERLDAAKAKELWDAEYGVIPDERADDGFYATGDLLKHWNDVLGSKPPRTFRVKAGDAPEYIGAKIDTDEIPAIFGRFGKAEEARDMVIDGKVREVLNNRTVDLVNGWTLKQVPRDGAKKVMVRGVDPTEIDAVAKELGGEVSKKRIFIEPDAAKLRKIIEEHPANLYRDDEKIGDTGNLRFFNETEELTDEKREEMRRRWMEGTRDIPVGDRKKFPGIFGDETVVDRAKADYDALPKIYELPSRADLAKEEADAAFRRHIDSIGERDKALAEWAKTAPDVLPFTDADRDIVYLVSKDTKEPGRWRVSDFVKHDGGMMITGHATYDTKAKAVKEASLGRREYDPSVRFMDSAEEARESDRDKQYRDWLAKYRLADTERHRKEWERKNPAPKDAVSEERTRITPAEDAAYMDAVERGDTGTAQRMVREAAARAMPDTKVVDENGEPMVVYHGNSRSEEDVYDDFTGKTPEGFRTPNVFDMDSTMEGAIFLVNKRSFAENWVEEWSEDSNDSLRPARVRDFYVDLENPLVVDRAGEDWSDNSIIVEDAKRKGHDGVIIRNVMEGTDNEHTRDLVDDYIAFSSSQIKSADPVTYDDTGNVIPLSQRFNRANQDIRYFNIDEEAGRRVHAKDLDEARRMEGAGAGRREIWEKTGWWKAKDGKWRYEIAGISDADTKRMLDFALASGKFYDHDRANVYSFTLNDLEAAMREKGERLPDSVKTLLAAYPKLGKETIEVDRMAAQPMDGTLGYATKGKIHLYERGTTAETLNHELQHRIQAASGMAGGTNTDGKSFGRYTQEHGEWEARQAATRAGMDADERGRTAPWETADRHGVAEDMTQIDDANRARIRPDGEPEEPEPAAPAADRDTTLGEKYRTNVTDRYDPLKQMEIATGKRDKKDLHVENSPYNAMRLLHGHNEAARQRYEKIWKRPFEDMLRKSGVTADDVGMYMIAENAKDRNRKVMDRSGVLDGAGISDADADRLKSDLRARLGDAKMQKIQEMANFLWKMQKEGMARRVESGRVSKEMADRWESEEQHHVPMRDDLSDENGEYNHSTRQWTQNDYRKAEGRYTLPDNPVEFMFKEYQDAMYGSNINEARRKLADFVRTTPGIGKIRKGVRIGKGWSFTHGQMENFADPNYREQTVKGGAGKPNLVSFKEGGDLYMIELNGKQGERVAEAVIGRGVHNIGAGKDSGAVAKLYAKGMRAYASTATEWSIPFLGRNVIADMIEASINTMADKGVIKGGAAAVKNAINAMRMSGTIYKYIKDGKFEGKFADVMRRYVESGSLIGGMGNEGVTEIKTDLGKVEAGKHGVLDVVKFMGRGISGINKMGELATRLAVFKNYIDGGASDGEASMRSREYSTDFNKYGNQRWMNSVWMFSGSVIGGATRQMASLALGKHGVQTITALFSYGVAEALLEHFYNADDDEKAKRTGASSGQTMNEHYRANSLYFRMGDKFIRIPFHAGPFSMIKYAGNLVARLALGDIDGAEFAKRLGKESVDNGMHFTGTGDFNSDTIAQSIAPTLAVPFVQAKGNENYLGNPIAKRMYSETKPYSENGRKYTSDVWKGIARGMNALGGGNEKRRGLELFDNRPEMYKNAWDSLGKNVTRDISTVVDFVTDLVEGKTVDNRHKLVLGDYWKDVPDNTDNFYEAERLYKSRRADGTIKQGSRRDEAVKKLLREIDTLRHWEAGEEKKGGKWVPMRKAPSESAKEKNKKMRLKYQQQVINMMNR